MTKALMQGADAVRQQENDFRLAVYTIPALVWTALPNGYCDFLNQRGPEYTGLTFEEAAGWGSLVAVYPEDLPRLMDVLRVALAAGQTRKRMSALHVRHRGNPDRLARSP